jgi:hypothetical protein
MHLRLRKTGHLGHRRGTLRPFLSFTVGWTWPGREDEYPDFSQRDESARAIQHAAPDDLIVAHSRLERVRKQQGWGEICDRSL